jgi:hypothetical protein
LGEKEKPVVIIFKNGGTGKKRIALTLNFGLNLKNQTISRLLHKFAAYAAILQFAYGLQPVKNPRGKDRRSFIGQPAPGACANHDDYRYHGYHCHG